MRCFLFSIFTISLFAAPAESTPGACEGAPKPFKPGAGDWNGWSPELTNSRLQAQPKLTAADVPKLKLKWAFGFPGDTRDVAQVTVVGGRVFVGSYANKVYS